MTDRPTVLLCDDSRALRMLAARQLSDGGFEVVAEAGNGHEAAERYRAHRPAVVLLDLVMPEADGKQALRSILEHDPQAKVVILSSLGAKSDIEECLRMGAASYLQKPIDPEAMLRVLRQVVG
jgi:two-component system chemotaxis response regulator CheY